MKAKYRCGNVHDTNERMPLLVDGLHKGILSLVFSRRDAEREYSRNDKIHLTYLELVRFSKNDGEAFRARQTERTCTKKESGPPAAKRSAVMFKLKKNLSVLLESAENSRLSCPGRGDRGENI